MRRNRGKKVVAKRRSRVGCERLEWQIHRFHAANWMKLSGTKNEVSFYDCDDAKIVSWRTTARKGGRDQGANIAKAAKHSHGCQENEKKMAKTKRGNLHQPTIYPFTQSTNQPPTHTHSQSDESDERYFLLLGWTHKWWWPSFTRWYSFYRFSSHDFDGKPFDTQLFDETSKKRRGSWGNLQFNHVKQAERVTGNNIGIFLIADDFIFWSIDWINDLDEIDLHIGWFGRRIRANSKGRNQLSTKGKTPLSQKQKSFQEKKFRIVSLTIARFGWRQIFDCHRCGDRNRWRARRRNRCNEDGQESVATSTGAHGSTENGCRTKELIAGVRRHAHLDSRKSHEQQFEWQKLERIGFDEKNVFEMSAVFGCALCFGWSWWRGWW